MAKQLVQPRKRPPAAGTPVQVRLQPDALKRLDAWIKRGDKRARPSRPEAIRHLVDEALDLYD